MCVYIYIYTHISISVSISLRNVIASSEKTMGFQGY